MKHIHMKGCALHTHLSPPPHIQIYEATHASAPPAEDSAKGASGAGFSAQYLSRAGPIARRYALGRADGWRDPKSSPYWSKTLRSVMQPRASQQIQNMKKQ